MRIDIYSDTVCPGCYLGKWRFELALAAPPQYEPRVPDLPPQGVDRAGHLANRAGTPLRLAHSQAELKRQGESRGIDFRLDLSARDAVP